MSVSSHDSFESEKERDVEVSSLIKEWGQVFEGNPYEFYLLFSIFYSSALMVLISSFAAQFNTSSRFNAVAIKLGNWSGVQANTGEPSVANSAANLAL